MHEAAANGTAALPIQNVGAHIKFARHWEAHGARYLAQAVDRSCPVCGSSPGSPWFATQDGYRYDVCRTCRMIFIPRVLPLAVWDAYYEDMPQAREWLIEQMTSTVSGPPAGENRARFLRYFDLLQRCGLTAGGARLLDVGTYTGGALAAAAERGLLAHGIEGLHHAVQFAKRRGLAQPIEWAQAESFHPALFGGHFDLVTMWETLEHTIAPREVLARAHQALRPGGMLAMSVPNALNPQFSILREHCYFAYGGYHGVGHLNLFTTATLQQLLEQTGFALVHAETEYGTDWRQIVYYLQHRLDRIHCYRNIVERGDFEQQPGPDLALLLNWLSPALTRLENALMAGPILIAVARRR